MKTLRTAGLVGLGLALVAAVGGGVWWWFNKRGAKVGPTPSKPPRVPERADEDEDEPVAPSASIKARGHMIAKDDLPAELAAELDESFPKGWPPDDKTIDMLETGDAIVFAVESEPVGSYDQIRRELITAKVLSVESTMVRGRVVVPVAYAEHIGAHAGHAFRPGALVEVPRSKVLLAARPGETDKTGYNSQGMAVQTFEPMNKTPYQVRPATPYDLALPYRTDDTRWYVDRDLVKVNHIGQRGFTEQIAFTEDSLRGDVTIRAIDEDPVAGDVLIARWQFALDA